MRQQLLEGFLLRLARARDAEAYALRGGMLVHQWLPEVRRAVGDIDLVCALPYRVIDLRERLQAVLRYEVRDGVVFDTERIRLDRTTQNARPALTLFASGSVDGSVDEITVDLTFQLDVWPAATRHGFVADRGSARVWSCAPEMVIATKLAVIAELGPRAWRPKDLADLSIALRRFSPVRLLGETFERRLGAANAGDAILASPWLHDDRAAMRWGRQTIIPGKLATVIAEARDKLRVP